MKNSVQGALDVRIDIRIPDYYTPLNMSLEREHADPIESTDKLQTPFAEKYRAGYLGERTRRNEDGTETTYYAYRFVVQKGSDADEAGFARVCITALQEGYKEAMSTVIIPDTFASSDRMRAKRDNKGLLCSVFMFLEKTTPQPKEDTSPSSPEEAVFIRTKRIG